MKNNFQDFLIILILVTIAAGCGQTSHLYRYDAKDRNYPGKLNDSVFNTLKSILTGVTGSKLKDTIIIKYDYNHESCWELLDQKDNDYVMRFVIGHQAEAQNIFATRPNVSIFDFREPGEKLNKIKKLDKSIIIDSTKKLYDLLFKERNTCGNFIMVMPDKRFVFMRSDSHSEIFRLTQQQVQNILDKKQMGL